MFDLTKIHFNTAFDVALVVVSIICAPIILFWLYDTELFLKVETLKLLLLSTALGIPPMLSSYAITSIVFSTTDNKLDYNIDTYVNVTASGLLNFILWSLTAVISFVFYRVESIILLNTVLYTILILHILGWLFALSMVEYKRYITKHPEVLERIEKRKKDKENQA